ncbi:MAG: tail fiber domain-containing protein [Flavobacteriales bacterium]|nr:tail fiber domain-containing protein [Flavobacteriales bacterium]
MTMTCLNLIAKFFQQSDGVSAENTSICMSQGQAIYLIDAKPENPGPLMEQDYRTTGSSIAKMYASAVNPLLVRVLVITCVLSLLLLSKVQGQIGIGTNAPDPSAILHMVDTQKGLLISKMTLVQRNAITLPATGLLIYQIDNAPGYYYNAGSPGVPNWVRFFSGSTFGGWDLAGNAGTTVGTNFLGTTDAQDLAIYTNNKERMRVTSAGNVGIGTSTPSATLSIGNGSIEAVKLSNANNVATTPDILMASGGVIAAETSLYINSDADGTNAGHIRMGSGAGTSSATQHMIVQNDGDVGIGATDPLHKLEVGGAISVTGAPAFVGSSGTLIGRYGTAGTHPNAGLSATNNISSVIAHIASGGNGGLAFDRWFAGAYDRTWMYLSQSGNVGIGTTTPGTHVHINSGIKNNVLNLESTDRFAVLLLKDNTTTGSGVAMTRDGDMLTLRTQDASRLTIQPDGKVGIGISNPVSQLHVKVADIGTAAGDEVVISTAHSNSTNGNFLQTKLRRHTAGTDWTGTNFRIQKKEDITLQAFIDFGIDGVSTSRGLGFGTGSPTATRMVIDDAGNVGIGTTTPGGQLELSLDQGRKPATSTWTIASDERLKNIEGSYTKGLKEILQLEPINYRYINVGERKFTEEVLNTQNVGFSAQEVQKIFPEAVGTDADGYLNLNMHAVLVAYVNAIKELKAENDALKLKVEEIDALKVQNTSIELELAEIRAMLGIRTGE